MKSDLFPAILCIALLALPLAAQDDDKDKPQVSLKLDLVAWGQDIPGITLKKSGGDTVTALAFRYSTPVRYAGAQSLEIYQDPAEVLKQEEKLQELAKGVDLQGMPPPRKPARLPAPAANPNIPVTKDGLRLLATATLPSGSSRATIILAPGRDGMFQAHVIDDDPSKLPYGKLRVHNYCPLPIALRANGGELREMQPRQAAIFPTKDDAIIYELAFQLNGHWEMQENNLVRVTPDEQAQMIVLKSDADFFTNGDGSRGGFLQVVTLRRTKEPPEPATSP